MRRQIDTAVIEQIQEDINSKLGVLLLDYWDFNNLTRQQSEQLETFKYGLLYGGQYYNLVKVFITEDRINLTYQSMYAKNERELHIYEINYERHYAISPSGLIDTRSFIMEVN